MDIFIEKIVTKRKDAKDYAILASIIIGTLFLILMAFNFVPSSFSPIVVIGLLYLAYRLITAQNLEYEYAVTNGDLDIDKIVAQRKRKRIFSANCKDFEVVARVGSSHFTPEIQRIGKKIAAAGNPGSPEVYFVVVHYKGERTVLFFEPDERMLKAFKTYIPKKIFE